MEKYDVVIYSYQEVVEKNTKGAASYEDQLLRDKLSQLSLKVAIKGWDDNNFDPQRGDISIIRTCWNYFGNLSQFQQWLHNNKDKTTFINSANIIEWNLNKKYLLDLEKNGVPIIPTTFVPKGDKSKKMFLDFFGTLHKSLIVKPAVSAGAYETHKVQYTEAVVFQPNFERMLSNHSLLIQPYIETIETNGEISLIIIGGRFAHGVKKKPEKGDFRVQNHFGGGEKKYDPTADEIQFAEKVIQAIPFEEKPVIARVDFVEAEDKKYLLMELELIEPQLFFHRNENSAKILADEIFQIFSKRKEKAN
jgi:glutathione synthase/RimK-type ligase-like ATP-grasp enzyme